MKPLNTEKKIADDICKCCGKRVITMERADGSQYCITKPNYTMTKKLFTREEVESKQREIIRIVMKVNKMENGCWELNNVKPPFKYSQVWTGTKSILAHRYFYTLFKGDIPKNLTIDHLCRNTKCVNPEHLEAVSLKENVLRGFGVPAVNKRKTHCLNGHPFSGRNLVIGKKGRCCRICNLERTRICKRLQAKQRARLEEIK